MPTWLADRKPILVGAFSGVETDKLASRLQAVLTEFRRNACTIGWAIAALVATAGWLYFIARTAYFLFNWLLG
jgi:hypothetical protein